MNIYLSPTRSDATLTASKQGDVLTINEEVFDFSVITEGETLPPIAVSGGYFTGDIKRIDGEVHLTFIFPHGANPSQAAAFPVPLINAANGVLELPR